MVIDAAVEYEVDLAGFITQRLVLLLPFQRRVERTMAQTGGTLNPNSAVVRSAMSDCISHALQDEGIDRHAVEVYDSCDSAQGLISI